ncbi:GDP-mannose 4,6-dehydratase [Candidatus Pelagibacter bacterium]|nr:GDP-mannose 4,6-dehydratase [Candidatus Pelagibacter bacterium]MDA8835312.1 GDP-mannose 4,6-dehydratase [Candidatus Pelagibacter bacterium]
MKKKALIFGVTGQDGSLLARLLLNKNYEVHGVKRRSSSFNTGRIDDIFKKEGDKKFFLHFGDLTDALNIQALIAKIKPKEIYNLGAQSHVKVSFDTPEYTANTDAMGALRILESIRAAGLTKKTKFYQASTSEMFGNSQKSQNENTPFHPESPYGTAKLFSYWITKNYRKAYGIFASNGILFNHEGEFRGETFLTRKVTIGVARIFLKKSKVIFLGNLNAKRDWGDAQDYVEGMYKILQHKTPEDFVLATGKTYSVREFVEYAFQSINIRIKWKGKGLKEVGYDAKNKNRILIKINKKYFRPNEVDHLLGDYKKAKKLIKWKPKITFREMIKKMVLNDINLQKKSIY